LIELSANFIKNADFGKSHAFMQFDRCIIRQGYARIGTMHACATDVLLNEFVPKIVIGQLPVFVYFLTWTLGTRFLSRQFPNGKS
jgi:hypothetical protein